MNRTLDDLTTKLGIVDAPAWFKQIDLKLWPMDTQFETMRQYPHRLRYGDFSEPGTGKTLPAQLHGIVMASLADTNKVVYVMPPKLIWQFHTEMLSCFKGVDRYLHIEHLAHTSKAHCDKLLTEWRTRGNWPDILMMSYDAFRTLNSRNKISNFSPATLVQKDGQLFTKHGDPVKVVPAKTSSGTRIKGAVHHKARNPYYLELTNAGYNVFFFDEAHTNLCNHQNIAWKTCKYMDKNLKDDVALYLMTGTPITKVEDSYGIVALVNPEAYANKTQFLRQHVIMDTKASFPRIMGYQNLVLYHQHLYKNARRVERSEKQPYPQLSVIPVHLKGAHQKLYKTYLKDKFAIINETDILSAENDQKLRQDLMQLVSVPEKFDSTGRIAKDNELRKALDAVLDTINPVKRKVIVFAKYVSTIEALAKHLAHLNPATLNGATQNSEEQIQKFLTDSTCRVFIVNWTSGGAGLNLQSCCSDAIFYEQPSNPKDVEQAMARVDRTGQTETVNGYFFNVIGTHGSKALYNLIETGEVNQAVLQDNRGKIYQALQRALK